MWYVVLEYAEAVIAERELEARQASARGAWERSVRGARPGVGGALRLLAREALWAIVGVQFPDSVSDRLAPRPLTGTAPRGAR